MKTKMIAIAALLSAISLNASAEDTARLHIVVEGTRLSEGNVMIAVYNSEADWLSTPLWAPNANPASPNTEVDAPALPPGEYAISVMHDLDADGALDSNFLGMPTEPYGFSNNVRGLFGPAKWKKASFTIAEGDNTVRIEVK